ncbi:hypothetical protein Q2941_28030 [Bradyrhizobium sp. UFLA05-153]
MPKIATGIPFEDQEDLSPRERGQIVLVQARWSRAAIKQHRDPGGTKADFDDRTGLVRQIWAPNGTKLAYLKAGADHKAVGPSNHFINPN